MTLSAVLLAGGLSRRMGIDKATILVNGEPLWQRQLRVIQALNPATVWVSCRERPSWCPASQPLIVDAAPSRGPLSGITATLSCLRTSHLLVLAVDLPRMTSAHLAHLWATAREGVGVIPSNQPHLEPLAAVYPREAAPVAHRAVESGDMSMQHFASALIEMGKAITYPLLPGMRELYLNVNTPEDFSKV